MDRFNALGRGAQLMLIGGVLLLIDLFLPWQDLMSRSHEPPSPRSAAGADSRASFSGS